MHREELIQYIKTNDLHYANLTFEGHTTEDLIWIKQKIEEEKRKEEIENAKSKNPHFFSKLLSR